MKTQREEALELASQITVLRAELEVDLIMSAPDELVEQMLEKNRAELKKLQGLTEIAKMVRSFSNDNIEKGN